MSNIVLSGGVRSNLLHLQATEILIQQTQVRLATGKKVNSALDNPTNFFTAQSLNNRAGDLSTLLDSMSNAVKTLQAADNGMSAITKLVQSAQALARQAQQTTDAAERATLATQFNETLTQIDALAADSGFNGKNLIDGDDLDVVFNEDGSSTMTITGADLTTGGDLAIAGAVGAWAHRRRHPDLARRSHDRVGDAAHPVQGVRFDPFDRAGPPGLHQADDQHADDRRGRPDTCRLQRGRREPARLADPATALDHGPVARRAERPKRAAPVR